MDMRRRTVIGLGVAAGVAVAASARAAESPGVLELEGETGRYRQALDDIRAYAARHVAVYGLPGLTLAVVAPDGVSAFMRFGAANVETGQPLTPDHLFQIGSISKSFTALCVYKLV